MAMVGCRTGRKNSILFCTRAQQSAIPVLKALLFSLHVLLARKEYQCIKLILHTVLNSRKRARAFEATCLIRAQESRLDECVDAGFVAVVVEGATVDVKPFLELRQDATPRAISRPLHAGQALDSRSCKVTPPCLDLIERHQNLLERPIWAFSRGFPGGRGRMNQCDAAQDGEIAAYCGRPSMVSGQAERGKHPFGEPLVAEAQS